MIKSKEILKSKNFLVLALFLFIYIFVFSYKGVWVGDDMNYAINLSNNKAVTCFLDILESQNYHYLFYNGRYLAHCIVQFLLSFTNHFIFAFMNGIVYVVFLYLILLNTVNSFSRSSLLFIICLILIGFQTKFVPSCQVGFVWMFCLGLLCVYLFLHVKGKKNLYFYLCLALLGICAGNGQEALNIGLLCAFCVYALRHPFTMSLWQWIIFVSFFIGCVSNVLSPESHSRLDSQTRQSIADSVNVFLSSIRVFYVLIVMIIYKSVKNRQISFMREVVKKDSFFLLR